MAKPMKAKDAAPQWFDTSDGQSIAWYELVAGDNQPPLILQHGFSANTRHEWVDCGIAEQLAALGRRIIGIDALGHGASAHPHETRYYQNNRMSRDVMELATHLGLNQYDFLGYSMGGVIAINLGTMEHRLRRLIVSGVGEGVVDFGGVDRRALDPALLAEGLRAPDVSPYPDLVKSFRANIIARGGDLRALAAHCDSIKPAKIDFDRISAPTMLVAGIDDPLALSPQRLSDAIPDCRLEVIPGDHVAARLGPDFTRVVLDFLK